MFANLGYLDPAFKGARPANLADRLQRSPETQVKVGFSVDYPLGNGALLINGDWFSTAEYRVGPANLAVTAPLLPVSATLTGPFEIFNASVGYSWNEDKYSISAACSNCLREEYSTAGQFIGTFATVYPGEPRFYRLTGTIKF